MIKKAPNINHLWAQLIVEELIRCRVTHFFIAPGSRSTPLVTAVARNSRANSIVHFDERGTAFAALGYARAFGRPAAWITTSGTAVANGLPAVVEASIDTVPLLILTADRPPELRSTGANQTIDQPGIFGRYVSWAFDGPAPDERISPAMLLTTVDQAVHRSAAGPVHLNWMFREPLAPTPVDIDFGPYLAPLVAWEASRIPFTSYAPVKKAMDEQTAAVVDEIVAGSSRGVVVAGRMPSPSQGLAALQLAEALGWPLFADIGSQIRLGSSDHPAIIRHPDFLLDKPAFSEGPDVVLQIGRRGVSKKLQNWIFESAVNKYVVIDDDAGRLDPTHGVTLRIEADIVTACARLSHQFGSRPRMAGAWLHEWQQSDLRTVRLLDSYFERNTELSEPLIARTLSRLLRVGDGLVLSSSMPVRDMDVFAVAGRNGPHIISNRGASGIDGIVATAAGGISGWGRPATLLVGDLSLLHDLNSLALLSSLSHPLIIVVINNDGGGIFSFLPVSAYKDIFERYFATPHGLNFEAPAQMFGLAYEKPNDIISFEASYRAALDRRQSTIIEMQTDREKNLAIHKAITHHLMAEPMH